MKYGRTKTRTPAMAEHATGATSLILRTDSQAANENYFYFHPRFATLPLPDNLSGVEVPQSTFAEEKHEPGTDKSMPHLQRR
jgi:hypothetical protein